MLRNCVKCGVLFDSKNCKVCKAAYHAAWRAANPDKIKADKAAYRAANPDKIKAAKSTHYAANRGKLKALSAAYRAANPGKIKTGQAAHYAANKKKRKATNAAWRAANPDRVKAYSAAYIANPDKKRASSAAYRAANPEKTRAAVAAWAASNLEAGRIKKHNYQARKRANGGTLSRGLSAKLFILQNGLCACCGKPLGKKYHLDHIMPLALGGPNEDHNMQLLLPKCNFEKGAKHPDDFMRERAAFLTSPPTISTLLEQGNTQP